MIKKEMVFVNEKLKTKKEVIEFITKKAFINKLISNEKEFRDAVFAREHQIPTSVGHFIAIPHGKSFAVKEPFVAYVWTESPFIWDSKSGDMVQSIFLIGVPYIDSGKTHLQYISQVSKRLINDDFRKELFSCKSTEDAFARLRSINEGIQQNREEI